MPQAAAHRCLNFDDMEFEMAPTSMPAAKGKLPHRGFASASAALSDSVLSSATAPPSTSAAVPKVDLKPATDVLAGAFARAASQSTIHPLDTLKVRMQTGAGRTVARLGASVVPATSGRGVLPTVASLYKGVVGAASGAGIAIGAYFAFYGAATNLLVRHTSLQTGSVAFVAGALAAAGGSIVKVPLAVCIRSVQAGVYPNMISAARSITAAAGAHGLFTGYLPTLMEDVPDMAFKFCAYESLRSLHRQFVAKGRPSSCQEDFAVGAVAGAVAAAATTPLDVIKTTMMCSAAARPTMASAARAIYRQGGPKQFFRGVGPRALSNGVNSAVFFVFFEALRGVFKRRAALAHRRMAAAAAAPARRLIRSSNAAVAKRLPGSTQTPSAAVPRAALVSLSFQLSPRLRQARRS